MSLKATLPTRMPAGSATETYVGFEEGLVRRASADTRMPGEPHAQGGEVVVETIRLKGQPVVALDGRQRVAEGRRCGHNGAWARSTSTTAARRRATAMPTPTFFIQP